MAEVDAQLKRRLSATLAAGVLLAATFMITSFPRSAVAADHRGGGGGGHRGGGGGGHRGGGWGGGYYAAPPVVYGSPYYAPYYAPPPVVFGVPFGLNINIR